MYPSGIFAPTYFLLTILDIITTRIGVKNPALAEGNHIMSVFVHDLSTLVFVKFIGFLMVIFLTNHLYNRNPKLAVVGIIFVTTIYITAIFNNAFLIMSH